MENNNSKDQLTTTVENIAESKFFESAWMASRQEQQAAFDNNLAVVVLEDGQLTEISPDGSKRILKRIERKTYTVKQNKFKLHRP